MRRVVGVLSVAILAAGYLAVGGSASRTAPSAAGKSITIHLVEKSLGFNFVDNPPRQGNAAPLIGDQFAFTSQLLTKSGAKAGMLNATCMVSRGGVHGVAVCYGVFMLKGGEIAGIASTSLSGDGPDHIAIVGGTGAYESASGSVLSVSRGENSAYSDDTFHLVLP